MQRHRVADYAFSGCTSLTSVTIPSRATKIGNDSFSHCASLASITIPSSVTNIGWHAFSDCNSLACVTIPNRVTSIGGGAFSGCTSLVSITIPNSVTSIGWGAFSGCASLTSVTIPSSVTSIGGSAFSGCTSLATITIPSNITNIEDQSFSACTSLTNATIPDSVTSIGWYAFSGCAGLPSVTIPSSVTTIESWAFADCTGLAAVYFRGNAPNWDALQFDGANNATVYYLAGTTGWGATFGGRPTALWSGCLYALSPATQAMSASAGAGTFSVTTIAGCSWSAVPTQNWLHTTATSSGSGNGAVSYTVDANPSSSARSGTISLGGQTFTVTQAGNPLPTLTPASATAGAAGTSGSFAIATSVYWQAIPNAAWLHTASSGTGNGTVYYTVDSNTNAAARSGTITVGGQAFTVNQAARICTYALSATRTNVSAGSAAGSFTVSANSACGWTAVPNAAWLHTSSSGVGSGTVNYTVDANPAANSRSGTVTVGGQVFTVVQSAHCLLAQKADGSLAQWALNGTTLVPAAGVPLTPAAVDPAWQVVGYEDMDADGQPDVLFQHDIGFLGTWFMNGSQATAFSYLNPAWMPADWQASGVADLDGDGGKDWIYRHEDGWLGVNFMNGVNRVGDFTFFNPTWLDPAWRTAAVADFSGDGKSDLLLHHTAGWLGVYTLSGTTVTAFNYLNPAHLDPAWRLAGLADLNGDGKPDLVMQHTLGYLGVFFLNGMTVTSFSYLNPAWMDPAWKIKAVR